MPRPDAVGVAEARDVVDKVRAVVESSDWNRDPDEELYDSNGCVLFARMDDPDRLAYVSLNDLRALCDTVDALDRRRAAIVAQVRKEVASLHSHIYTGQEMVSRAAVLALPSLAGGTDGQ